MTATVAAGSVRVGDELRDVVRDPAGLGSMDKLERCGNGTGGCDMLDSSSTRGYNTESLGREGLSSVCEQAGSESVRGRGERERA